MHEIFISYSSRHRDLTRELAAALEAQYGQGAVWWDHALESRGPYAEQITAALEAARVVVVIWTADAAISNWVYSEANRALQKGTLVNARPSDVSFRGIPQPFDIHHIDDADDHERILATIAKVWNGTPIATRAPLHEIWYRQQGKCLLEPKQAALPTDVASAGTKRRWRRARRLWTSAGGWPRRGRMPPARSGVEPGGSRADPESAGPAWRCRKRVRGGAQAHRAAPAAASAGFRGVGGSASTGVSDRLRERGARARRRRAENAVVEQVFAAPQLQALLANVLKQNNIDGAPADQPMEIKRAIVAALVEQGIIQIGGEERD